MNACYTGQDVSSLSEMHNPELVKKKKHSEQSTLVHELFSLKTNIGVS